ncbi:hypothetical protein [Amycolatopsis sp. NPDC001319]|uniref:hypothetical protein n=1 Tax=unclassified Amycolatopsis TaxID=2618356 RepID=UPI0036B95FAE
MSQQQEKTSEQGEKKSFRPAQVVATALAAVTAALLGSTLGVAGTVVGAGVASVITTVGAELYLRSLQRTREAALKARAALVTAGQRKGSKSGLSPVDDPAQMPTVLLPLDPSEMPTVRISKLTEQPEPEESFGDKLRKLRWPLIIGTSVIATAIAIAVAVGADLASGGNVGPGLFKPGTPDTTQQQRQDDSPPTTSQNSPPPSETESNTPPPSSSSSSTSTSESPTSSSSSDSAPPPSSTGGAASTTPSAPQTKAGSATPTP